MIDDILKQVANSFVQMYEIVVFALNGGEGSGNHNPGQGRGVGKPSHSLYGSIINYKNMSTQQLAKSLAERFKSVDKAEEFKTLTSQSLDSSTDAQRASIVMGNDKKPEVMNSDEFDKTFPDDKRIYRAVHDDYGSMTSDNAVENLKNGEHTPIRRGTNNYDGIYFATTRDAVSEYGAEAGFKNSQVIVGALKQGTKIIHESQLSDIRKEATEFLNYYKNTAMTGFKGGIEAATSVICIQKGIDGIIQDRTNEMTGEPVQYLCLLSRQNLILRNDTIK